MNSSIQLRTRFVLIVISTFCFLAPNL